MRLPEKMLRMLVIFALTFVVVLAAGGGAVRETGFDLFARMSAVLVVFPGVLVSWLLHWRHGLSGKWTCLGLSTRHHHPLPSVQIVNSGRIWTVSSAAWFTGTTVAGTALLDILAIAPLQYSMKLRASTMPPKTKIPPTTHLKRTDSTANGKSPCFAML